MTVRQDGREIVCPLSAVTVFFIVLKLGTGFVYVCLYDESNFEISATIWHQFRIG